ncbi:MAG: four helix bundle protein [Phycisphaerae bacterium]
MNGKQRTGRYDLEERTLQYAQAVRVFIKRLPRCTANFEDSKQLVRSSGSVGANYIEANEALSKRDFLKCARIARKEAKESRYWLTLVDVGSDAELHEERSRLVGESTELLKILSAIIARSAS